MRTATRKLIQFFLFFIFINSVLQAENYRSPEASHLYALYKLHHEFPSDINEHLPLLRKLSSECSSVVEIGIRSIVSTWGVLQGLSESPLKNRSYLGIDIDAPPEELLGLAKSLAEGNGIDFSFCQANDMDIDLEPTDLLFIDTLHTYCHLTYELEKFAPHVRKYIAMHDTSEPWGNIDDYGYHGDYSEYPAHFDKTKRGLWPAVVDFLHRHPEWSLQRRHLNNHGFTILKRRSTDNSPSFLMD